MKTLLSPAKAIDTSKRLQTSKMTEPNFIDEASSLVKKLEKFSVKKIGKMMNLSPTLASLNYDRYQEWGMDQVINDSYGHAGAIFNGEAYRGLDATSFSEEELNIAQDKLRILSGLYGILKPLDVIHEYRLEMGTKWAVTPAKKNLYQFWGKKLALAINEEEEDLIINLASTEYFKALDIKTLKAKVITPVFKDLKNGEYKMIMVFAKQARGAMTKYIIKNNIDNAEQLKLFTDGGYQYDDNLSSETEWVFTR